MEKITLVFFALSGYAAFVYQLLRGRKFKKRVYTDLLTNVPNRRGFHDYFKRLLSLSKRKKYSFTVLMMDLDKFKKFNDTYGHPSGDRLLRTFAELVQRELRDYDMIARVGGEEFSVLLPETAVDEGALVAERLCQYVDETLNTTVSIGVAVFPSHGETQEELIGKADQALYKAKEKRNSVVVATKKSA